MRKNPAHQQGSGEAREVLRSALFFPPLLTVLPCKSPISLDSTSTGAFADTGAPGYEFHARAIKSFNGKSFPCSAQNRLLQFLLFRQKYPSRLFGLFTIPKPNGWSISLNRVGGAASPVLSHHRTYRSVYGGSETFTKFGVYFLQAHEPLVRPVGIIKGFVYCD